MAAAGAGGQRQHAAADLRRDAGRDDRAGQAVIQKCLPLCIVRKRQTVGLALGRDLVGGIDVICVAAARVYEIDARMRLPVARIIIVFQRREHRAVIHAVTVNDSIEAAASCGDTYNAIKDGVITKDDIYAEIGEIIMGKKKGRENDEEITVYDTVGMGVQDLAMAKAIYENALKAGIGSYFDFNA